MDKEKLKELINDDDLGLLDVKPKVSAAQSEDERLKSSFEEILDFIDKNGKEPKENFSDLNEHRLYSRLIGIQTSPDKAEALRKMDRHNLLDSSNEISSIDDVLNDDDLGILSSKEDDIFTIRNVPEIKNKGDFIGKTKPCKDFKDFEPLFIQCQADLKGGKRKLKSFSNDSSIKVNRFYIRNGVLLYISEINEREIRKEKNRDRVDFRLRIIYENGTESNVLRNTLAKRLRENGRRVTEHDERMLDIEPEEGDQEAGFIYILKSLSENPEIKNLENLYKIGYSRVPVEDRVKNAKNETTYLMAPVKIISTYQCYNLNTQKFEHLLHRFFGEACLNIDVFDGKNRRHTPREWFVVPLPAIEKTIELLIKGEITNYIYDARDGKISSKNSM